MQAQEARFHQQNCCQSLQKPRTGSFELMSRSGVRFLPKKFAQLLFTCTLWQNREIYATKPLSHLSHAHPMAKQPYSTKPVGSHVYLQNKWLGAPVWSSPFNRFDLGTGCMNHKNIRVLFSLCAASYTLLNAFSSGCHLFLFKTLISGVPLDCGLLYQPFTAEAQEPSVITSTSKK